MLSDGQTLTLYLLALVVGVLGWLVGKPFLAYRAIRADIARYLVLYANVPSYFGTKHEPIPPRTHEAQDKYRELASELVAFENTIIFYPLLAACKFIPTQKELNEAKGNLIGLSNSVAPPLPRRQCSNCKKWFPQGFLACPRGVLLCPGAE